MNKIYPSASAAIADIPDGATLMAGGFGLCGNPENLILALHQKAVRNLTVISNNCGTTHHGLGILLQNRQIRKMVSSYVGENIEFERQYLQGELEVELVPQGTLAERIRAGGAGIAAFFTPTGVGTGVELGGLPMRYKSNGGIEKISSKKESREFNGRTYILEHGLTADYAIVKAFKADPFGNLVFNKTARNFSPMMCTAAKITIVEAEHIVPLGALDPESIHVPGAYVQRIVQGHAYEKWIEQRTVRSSHAS